MHLRLTTLALASAMLLSASPAMASIELKFLEVDPGSGSGGVNLDYNGEDVRANIGQLVWRARNESGSPPVSLVDVAGSPDNNSAADNLITFCIELSQYVSSHWKTYEKTALEEAPKPGIGGAASYQIGADRAAALDLLADNFWGIATDQSSGALVNAIAFQLSIWEIVHETPADDFITPPLASSLNVSNHEGTFHVDENPSSGSTLSDAINLANGWLEQITYYFDGNSSTTSTLVSDDSLSLMALTNDNTYYSNGHLKKKGKQDQVYQYVSTDTNDEDDPVVPEPTSVVVWAGLMALGMSSSRRR